MDHSVTGYGHDSPHAPSRVQVIDSVKAKKALECIKELKTGYTTSWTKEVFKKYGF